MNIKKFQAKKFDSVKIPEPAAVPFDQVLGIKIPGRDIVAENFDKFIKRTEKSKNALISLIKADWGEGKTDAYERYITKKLSNHECYMVSTSTIIRRLEKIKNDSSSGSTSSNFLAATFASIGDDLYAKSNNQIKDATFYSDKIIDPVLYTEKVLQKTLAGNKKSLYIFIMFLIM